MKRSIRFADDECICIYHSGAVMDMEDFDIDDIWYQQSEMHQIKRKAMNVSREAQRYGLGNILSNTYGRSCEATQSSINMWVRNAAARRGLERWINNEFSAKRSDIRKRTIKSVLRAQAKLNQEGVSDLNYQAKILARLSEAFSQDSRKFAQVVGLADEIAVKELTTDSQQFRGEKEIEQDLKGHLVRTPSPNSVALMSQFRPRRNLGLSGGGVPSDMRQYC